MPCRDCECAIAELRAELSTQCDVLEQRQQAMLDAMSKIIDIQRAGAGRHDGAFRVLDCLQGWPEILVLLSRASTRGGRSLRAHYSALYGGPIGGLPAEIGRLLRSPRHRRPLQK